MPEVVGFINVFEFIDICGGTKSGAPKLLIFQPYIQPVDQPVGRNSQPRLNRLGFQPVQPVGKKSSTAVEPVEIQTVEPVGAQPVEPIDQPLEPVEQPVESVEKQQQTVETMKKCSKRLKTLKIMKFI